MAAEPKPIVDSKPAWGTLPVVRAVHPFHPYLLGIVFACVVLPLTLYPKHGGSVYSRYLTIDSVVERGTLAIEKSPMLPISGTPDIVKANGHSYSDKPPVLPVLASAVYKLLHLSGWRFWNPATQTEKETAFSFLVVNAVLTWVVVGLTSAMAVVGLRQLLQAVPIPRWVADGLALAFGLGSQLLTYAVTFNNHSVAAGLIMGAMALTSLERTGRNPARVRFLAGLFAGLAATIDLPVGCLILAGMGLIQAIRIRSIPWMYVFGAVGPLLLHCWLQSIVTGTPLPAEMYPELFNYPGSYWMSPEGTFHEDGPRIWFGLEMMVGKQGWLTLTPAILFGLVGLGMVLGRKGDPFRPLALVVSGSVLVLVVYYTWAVRRTDFGGLSFGVRHLLAITLPCFVFASIALARLRGWFLPLIFVALMAVGATYAWIGVRNPWTRIEIAEPEEPDIADAPVVRPVPLELDETMTPSKIPAWAKVVLFAILVLDVWWRCHTIGPTVRDGLGVKLWPVVEGEAEPLDCDEAAYATIGRGLTRGEVMYRDYSENKPPLGYWLFAATVKLGGANELAIRLMPIPFVLATITLVWWIGIRLSGPSAGCMAGLVYGLMSTDPYLYGNGANMEHFINLFAVGSLAAMVKAGAGRRPEVKGASDMVRAADPTRWLVLAGVLVGLATLVKQIAALHGAIYVVAVLVSRSKVKGLAALAIGFVGTCGLAVGVLWFQGAGSDAYQDVFAYGSALATLKVPDPNAPAKLIRWITGNADPSGKLPWPFQWVSGKTDYLVWWGVGSWPIWVASVPCLAWLIAGPKADRGRRLLAAWTLSAWAQVAAPGLFWQHYYLLPTPGLAIAVAITLAEAWKAKRSSFAPILGGITLLAAIGGTAQIQVRDYLMVPAEQLTARYKGGQQWIALRYLGREIARRTEGWDRPTLYVWGWQSPLFIYSNLDGPTRHFFADPLLEDYSRGHHRDDPRLMPRVDRIMQDLEVRPPSLALVAYPPFPRLRAFLERGYIRSSLAGMNPNSPDGIGFWVERSHYRAFEATGAPRSATAR